MDTIDYQAEQEEQQHAQALALLNQPVASTLGEALMVCLLPIVGKKHRPAKPKKRLSHEKNLTLSLLPIQSQPKLRKKP